MYCQFCGCQLTAGVNYCKQCGAVTRGLNWVSQSPSYPNTAGIAWAIAALGVGGLAVIFGTAIPLFTVAPTFSIVCMGMLFGFLVLSVGLGALIRHMQRVTSLAIKDRQQALQHPAPSVSRYLDADADAGVMPSVTENTTRSIDYPETREKSD
jgi:hypothetical protein